MRNSIEAAQLRLARVYAYVNEQVTSEDLELSQRASAVALELYAAAAQLASLSARVELLPDRACTSDSDAAEQLGQAAIRLSHLGNTQLAIAAQHLQEARRRLRVTGAQS